MHKLIMRRPLNRGPLNIPITLSLSLYIYIYIYIYTITNVGLLHTY